MDNFKFSLMMGTQNVVERARYMQAAQCPHAYDPQLGPLLPKIPLDDLAT